MKNFKAKVSMPADKCADYANLYVTKISSKASRIDYSKYRGTIVWDSSDNYNHPSSCWMEVDGEAVYDPKHGVSEYLPIMVLNNGRLVDFMSVPSIFRKLENPNDS